VNAPTLFQEAVHEFDTRVQHIGEGQWDLPTPDTDWKVRDVVNHLVSEDLWAVPLFEGATIGEVGDRFDGDLLGGDPKGAWKAASTAALASIETPGAMERTVHLSFGDFPATEYTLQLFADHLIHAWDLARAIGADETLDPRLVDACTRWFEGPVETAYRSGGAIADRPDIPEGADAQTRLLAMWGRRA
jgi:uncharacterized protein (TIGR03086 family)